MFSADHFRHGSSDFVGTNHGTHQRKNPRLAPGARWFMNERFGQCDTDACSTGVRPTEWYTKPCLAIRSRL